MNKTFTALCLGFTMLWLPLATLPAYAESIGPNIRCYVGATVGTESATVSAGVIDLGDNGYLAGAFAGCGAPMDRLVVGLEADVTFSNLSPDLGPLIIADTEYLASIRGRLGYEIGNALIFATLGVAFADLDITALGTKSGQSLTGVVYGIGVELEVTEHAFIRVDGQRYDFSGEAFANLGGTKADSQRDVFRVGAGWRF